MDRCGRGRGSARSGADSGHEVSGGRGWYRRTGAPGHLERQLAEGPSAPGGGVAGRHPAGCRVHAGDQAGRRGLPGADVRGDGLRVRPLRAGPVERRGDPVQGRAGGRRHELRRRRRARPRRPDHLGALRRHRRHQRLRPQRSQPGQPALPVQAGVARPAEAPRRRPRRTGPARDRRRRLQHRARPTPTSTTRASSSTPPTPARPSASSSPSCASGGSSTCSAPGTRRTGSTAGGTTAPATSTRAAACASTWCSARRPSPHGWRGR